MRGSSGPTLSRHCAGSRATDPAPRRGQATVEVRARGWYNQSLDYRHYMVPGILVQLVTLVGTLMTALNIVREKEARHPRPAECDAGVARRLHHRQAAAALADRARTPGDRDHLGRLVFGMPIEGSLLVVFFGAALYLVAALGIGLWISTVADTQQQALFVTFALTMVYTLMSGLFTPVAGMPAWAQTVAQVNPLLHFITLIRAVLLKGAGFRDVAGSCWPWRPPG